MGLTGDWARCPTCSDNTWTPGETCNACGDTPIEGQQYELPGNVDCDTCEGDPDMYVDWGCQHPAFVEWT